MIISETRQRTTARPCRASLGIGLTIGLASRAAARPCRASLGIALTLGLASLFASGCGGGDCDGGSGQFAAKSGESAPAPASAGPEAAGPAAADDGAAAAPARTAGRSSLGSMGESLAQAQRGSWDGDNRSLGGLTVGADDFVPVSSQGRRDLGRLYSGQPRKISAGRSAVPAPDFDSETGHLSKFASSIPGGPVVMEAYYDLQKKAYQTAYAVMDRAGWGAGRRKGGNVMMTPARITIHHTITANTHGAGETARSVRQIQDYHMHGRAREGKTPFDDIGYHFLIDGDGRVVQGRPSNVQGAHAYRANHGNIGIALMGNFDKHQPSPAQLDSLKRLTAYLALKYDINPLQRGAIEGHGHFTETTCPGRYLRAILSPLRDAVAKEKRALDEKDGETVAKRFFEPDALPFRAIAAVLKPGTSRVA